MIVRFVRKDNRGSALIVVLVSVLFLSIIAGIVMTISHANLESSRTNMSATDNFYKNEVALDELKDGLKSLAEEAIVKAYEKWLQTYTLVTPAEQSKLFSDLFSEYFEEAVKNYIEVTGKTPLGGSYEDYQKLMYDFSDDSSITTGTGVPKYKYDPVSETITISGISVTYIDENGNETTISTDLVLSVKAPTVEVGTSRGVNTNIKDFTLIADGEIRFSKGVNQKVVGSIYGGGKIPTAVADDDEYTGAGVFAYDNSKVKLYSDYIITRSMLRTQSGSDLQIFGKDELNYGAFGDAYSEVWAKNIQIDGSAASAIKIQGECNIADDLSIDSNGSTFRLMGNESKYYGYNTSSDGEHADTSSSIVVNGKNVTLDLSPASMLWLAGKSYVEVPSVWGYKKGETVGSDSVTSSTYMQGESISYRSLQASYLLPGDCIIGIYHNPMTKDEYSKLLKDGKIVLKSSTGTNPAYYIDISQGIKNYGINLELYLDYAQPVYKTEVQYGSSSSDILVYLYMNFANPNLAAAYFKNYNENEDTGALVASRIKMAESGTSLSIKTTGEYTDPDTKALLLPKTSVVNTGNILVYNGTNYTIYNKNTDYYDNAITKTKNDKKMAFQGLYTSLNKSLMGSKTKDLTENLVVYGYFTGSAANKDKAIAITDPITGPVKFGVDGTTETRDAYVIGASGDVWIESGGKVYYGTSGSGDSATHGSVQDPITGISAGIIIASGDVHVRCGSFWGTIIAKGNIIVDVDCDLRASSEYMAKIIQTNTIVSPYFSETASAQAEGISDASKFLSIEYKDWKKD